MAELLGESKMDDFPKIISGYDADGIIHRFKISRVFRMESGRNGGRLSV